MDFEAQPLVFADLETEHLLDDPYFLTLPSDHRLADKRAVALKDLADEDWINSCPGTGCDQVVLGACRAAGFEPRVVHEVTDTAASLALVARGLGVTFVTDLMLALPRARGLGVVALHEQVLRHIVLIRRAEAEEGATPERPAVAAVAALVAQVVAAPGSVGEQE
jgi:DNA-binding transcriptional LysR family regulator